jgi:UDP-glucose 4-epimerase
MSKCLVLGANGFIGSHLVDALVGAGHTVRAFDRAGGNTKYSADGVEPFYGNFLNASDLKTAVAGMDYVFHFISTTTPASAENDPLIDVETNIRMSIELFDICASANINRLIFASTGGAIYGDQGNNDPRREDDLPLPVSPYAIGKLTIENYLRYFKVKRKLDSIVLRISNPYGERQALHAKQGVIPIFIENLLEGKPLTVLGDGSMVRDYIYVKDVANIITNIFDKPAKHDIYNVGSGIPVAVSELVSAIEAVHPEAPTVEYKDAPTTFVHNVTLDVSRLQEEFGVSAQTSLHDGVAATYMYLKNELGAKHE